MKNQQFFHVEWSELTIFAFLQQVAISQGPGGCPDLQSEADDDLGLERETHGDEVAEGYC